jgi:PIN domain nuclease of toxin-antitoxin system
VSDSLLIDTHIAIWLNSGDDCLRHSTREIIQNCWRNGGTILFSAVSAWEIALLVHVGRLDLDLPAKLWVERFVQRPGIERLPLTDFAASRSYDLPDLETRDPADRLLVATAIDRDCPLVTYDVPITKFARASGRQYGFATAQ